MVDRPVSADEALGGVPAKLGWQLQLLAGVVTLVLGVILSFHPTTSLNVICVIIGLLFIASGIFHFIRALDPEEIHRVLFVIAAIVEVVIGVVLIRHLHLSRALIGLLVGITWIVQGVVILTAGIIGGAKGSRVLPIVFGLISVIAGIVVVSTPENSVNVLAVLVGIWFIVMGLLMIVSGFVLRSALKGLHPHSVQ